MADSSESSRGIYTGSEHSTLDLASLVASHRRSLGISGEEQETVDRHKHQEGDMQILDSRPYSRVRRASMADLSTIDADLYKKPRFEALSLLRYGHLVNQSWNISDTQSDKFQSFPNDSTLEIPSLSRGPLTVTDVMDDSRMQSGLNSPSSFRLPSFSSISSNVSPVTPGAQHGRRDSTYEAQTDPNILQQQLAARDHAIACLRRDHEQLQLSMLRTQSRYEALETKSQVTDHEMAAVLEEKNRLKQEAATHATQVEQLTHERKELQTQARADGAQWRQIMSMSSKLQMQNVEESRRFTADREQWAKDRERLEQRISELERASPTKSDSLSTLEVSQDLTRSLTLSSIPEDQLRQEIQSLQHRCQELEVLLETVMKKSASIERTGTLLKEVRKRITGFNSPHKGSDPSV